MSRVVAGRYEVLGEVGHGGMADVLRALDRRTGRVVALKMLKGAAARSPATRERLRREAHVLSALNHPGILRVFHFVQDDDQAGLVVELLEGRGFDQAIKDPAWRLRDRLEAVEQAARAIHAVHGAGIVHRDLKPGNLFLEKSGRVVVMDFGLAHLDAAAAPLTAPVSQLGTPWYMSPEQASGESRDVDSRADVWALGVILYEAVAGRVPWKGRTLAEVYREILEVDPPPLRGPRVPPGVEDLCREAMAKRREHRPATALEFAERLAAARTGHGTTSQTRAPARRARWPMVAAAAGLVVAGLAAWRLLPTPALAPAERPAPEPRVAGPVRPSSAPEDPLGRARSHRKAGDYDAAEGPLRDLLRERPSDAEVRLELAVVLLLKGARPSRKRFLEWEPWITQTSDRVILKARKPPDLLGQADVLASHKEGMSILKGLEGPTARCLRAAVNWDVDLAQLAAMDPGPHFGRDLLLLLRVSSLAVLGPPGPAWIAARKAVVLAPENPDLRLRAVELAWEEIQAGPNLQARIETILPEALPLLDPIRHRSAYPALLRAYFGLAAWDRGIKGIAMDPLVEDAAAAAARWPEDPELWSVAGFLRAIRAAGLKDPDSQRLELATAMKDTGRALALAPACASALMAEAYGRGWRASLGHASPIEIEDELLGAMHTCRKAQAVTSHPGIPLRLRAQFALRLVSASSPRNLQRLSELVVGAREDTEAALLLDPDDRVASEARIEVLWVQITFGVPGGISKEILLEAIALMERSEDPLVIPSNRYEALGALRVALAGMLPKAEQRPLLERALAELPPASDTDWSVRAVRLKAFAALERWKEAAEEARHLTTIATVDRGLEKLIVEVNRRAGP